MDDIRSDVPDGTTLGDPVRDEDLVSAYLKGDTAALEILLTRYSTIILSFIGGKSFFYKDEPYLDDIRQEVLIKVFKGIKEFTSTGPGSFKRWVFRIAYFETLSHDKARRKGLKLTSEIFTEETTGIPDDLVFELTPRISEYDRASDNLNDTLTKLSDEEINLMTLVSRDIKYQDIIKYPEFMKYSLEALKQKIYNIRKRMSNYSPCHPERSEGSN